MIPLQPLQFMNNNELEPLDDSSKDLFQLWTKILVSFPVGTYTVRIKDDFFRWLELKFPGFMIGEERPPFMFSPMRVSYIIKIMGSDYEGFCQQIPHMTGILFNWEFDIYFMKWDSLEKKFIHGDFNKGFHWIGDVGIFRN